MQGWEEEAGLHSAGGRGEERHKQRAAEEGWPVVKNFSGSTNTGEEMGHRSGTSHNY